MAEDIIIRAEGLGKKYVIGHHAESERYVALRDVLARGAKAVKSKVGDFVHGRLRRSDDTAEEFWALKDVSFEVKRGDVLGIIGRNGAGKSTLLKILSRITEPSVGRVTIKGRVASLLEVGTGFHPELTGRENIYLNGAILGMRRAEIRRKFDEIVAFAEVEKFLDTPVKHYSSGMYVRLAFAVAAHLEPEILVIDEVLAVGDVEFQKKCLGKMQDVAGQGRTVLFVSHNMEAISRLCNGGVLLDGGSVVFCSRSVEELLSRYVRSFESSVSCNVWKRPLSQTESPHFAPELLRVNGADQPELAVIPREMPISVEISGTCVRRKANLTIGFAIYDESERLLFWSYQTDSAASDDEMTIPAGRVRLTGMIPAHLLNPGRYRVELIGGVHNVEWSFKPNATEACVWFEVGGKISRSPYWTSRRPGLIAPIIPWTILQE